MKDVAVLISVNEHRYEQQRECDSDIRATFAQKTINQLRLNPVVIEKLKELYRKDGKLIDEK